MHSIVAAFARQQLADMEELQAELGRRRRRRNHRRAASSEALHKIQPARPAVAAPSWSDWWQARPSLRVHSSR